MLKFMGHLQCPALEVTISVPIWQMLLNLKNLGNLGFRIEVGVLHIKQQQDKMVPGQVKGKERRTC